MNPSFGEVASHTLLRLSSRRYFAQSFLDGSPVNLLKICHISLALHFGYLGGKTVIVACENDMETLRKSFMINMLIYII